MHREPAQEDCHERGPTVGIGEPRQDERGPDERPPERNRPCPPPDELGVLTHSLPARGHRLSLDQMARVPRLAPGLVASPSLRPHLYLVPAPHSAAGVLGKGSGELLLVGQLVGARCLLTPRSSAISTRLIPRD